MRVGFDNGDVGELDLSKHMIFQGLLKPLADPDFVAKAFVNREIGTVCWPNGLDLDPVVLHHRATGKPMPEWAGPIVD